LREVYSINALFTCSFSPMPQTLLPSGWVPTCPSFFSYPQNFPYTSLVIFFPFCVFCQHSRWHFSFFFFRLNRFHNIPALSSWLIRRNFFLSQFFQLFRFRIFLLTLLTPPTGACVHPITSLFFSYGGVPFFFFSFFLIMTMGRFEEMGQNAAFQVTLPSLGFPPPASKICFPFFYDSLPSCVLPSSS